MKFAWTIFLLVLLFVSAMDARELSFLPCTGTLTRRMLHCNQTVHLALYFDHHKESGHKLFGLSNSVYAYSIPLQMCQTKFLSNKVNVSYGF